MAMYLECKLKGVCNKCKSIETCSSCDFVIKVYKCMSDKKFMSLKKYLLPKNQIFTDVDKLPISYFDIEDKLLEQKIKQIGRGEYYDSRRRT